MSQRLALVFLVLLRIAIGWHFGFEGYEKKRSVDLGPSFYNNYKVWSSEDYLQQGNGPLAKFVKSRIGDPDDQLLARVTPRDSRMPELLDKEWDDYFQRFVAHYALDPAKQEAARRVFEDEKGRTVRWLTAKPGSIDWFLSGQWTDFDRTPFKRNYPGGTYDAETLSVADRVAEYKDKLAEYRGLAGTRSYKLGKDVEKSHRPAVRAELGMLRSELQGLVDKRTDEMKKSLADAVLSKDVKALPPPPPPEKPALIKWLDRLTIWTLLIVGGCLMLGLFSRTAALVGAGFLVMTLLTHPPLPWYPEPPNAEGHYIFISKNVIEMLALFMLACIPTGRWFGIDALLHALSPFRKTTVEEE
jgi:uncharacterized membrane protein YphA (DoxX/SURF4 family)